jgi:hypothetical protein
MAGQHAADDQAAAEISVMRLIAVFSFKKQN